MSRSIPAGLAAKIEGDESLTLRKLVSITRKTDGETVRFTDHWKPVTYSGDVYEVAVGVRVSGLTFELNGRSTSMDVVFGTEGATIQEADIRAGIYDSAEIFVSFFDPAEPDEVAPLFAGKVGNIEINEHGYARLEFTGLLSKARLVPTEHYSPSCRVRAFGDWRCKLPVLPRDVRRSTLYGTFRLREVENYVRVRIGSDGTPEDYQGLVWKVTTGGTTAGTAPSFSGAAGTVVNDGSVTFTAEAAQYVVSGQVATYNGSLTMTVNNLSTAIPDDWPNVGLVIIRSGPLNGKRVPIRDFVASSGTLQLYLPFESDEIAAGTWVEIMRGCPRTRAACIGYNNILNMRAEPDVPGQDMMAITYNDWGAV